MRPTEKRRMLTKTTMASLDAAQHTEHLEGAEHRQKAEQNHIPLKPAVWVFHHQQGVSWRYCSWVSGFQDIRRDGDRTLGYTRPRKNGTKKRKNMTSRGMKHKTAI